MITTKEISEACSALFAIVVFSIRPVSDSQGVTGGEVAGWEIWMWWEFKSTSTAWDTKMAKGGLMIKFLVALNQMASDPIPQGLEAGYNTPWVKSNPCFYVSTPMTFVSFLYRKKDKGKYDS